MINTHDLIHAMMFEAAQKGASDVFLSEGEPPVYKIWGSFQRESAPRVTPMDMQEFIRMVLPPEKQLRLEQGYDVDLGYTMEGVGRFRLNVFRHLQGMSLAVRPLPSVIPSLSALGLPAAFQALTELRHGLILVTGAAGTGKTTTLASFINAVNEKYERHIIAIEDPIEYVIPNARSLIHQREVGTHTPSFADGLRSALRENPDVIVVGELRDLESISLALTAAETGHLVLGTLHSGSAAQALTRVIDVFDAARQPQIMIQLAQSLQAVCSQRLLKRKGRKGMVLATDLLLVTLAISNIIRQNRIHEIRGFMQSGRAEDMHTLQQSINALITRGEIAREDASAVIHLLNSKMGY